MQSRPNVESEWQQPCPAAHLHVACSPRCRSRLRASRRMQRPGCGAKSAFRDAHRVNMPWSGVQRGVRGAGSRRPPRSRPLANPRTVTIVSLVYSLYPPLGDLIAVRLPSRSWFAKTVLREITAPSREALGRTHPRCIPADTSKPRPLSRRSGRGTG